MGQHSAPHRVSKASPDRPGEPDRPFESWAEDFINANPPPSLPMGGGMSSPSKHALVLTRIADSFPVQLLPGMLLVKSTHRNHGLTCIGQDHLLVHGGAQASIMDDGVFMDMDQDSPKETDIPLPDIQFVYGSPKHTPVQPLALDTERSPGSLSPYASPTAAIGIPGYVFPQAGPSLLMTPLLTASSFSVPFSAGLASGIGPPLSRAGSSLGPSNETPYEDLLEEGYPGNSPTAIERRAVLRGVIVNETAQVPNAARDIMKLADVRKLTDEGLEDAFPSWRKKSTNITLYCAWAGCTHYCSRPDRLKTHVFIHIGFKPFPCDRSCGDPHW